MNKVVSEDHCPNCHKRFNSIVGSELKCDNCEEKFAAGEALKENVIPKKAAGKKLYQDKKLIWHGSKKCTFFKKEVAENEFTFKDEFIGKLCDCALD
ncbi:MAG: hypothetical protein PHQ23_10920 [Candidatus Wallbacteria bacterium]|nr:hypothetical protein [Candidatus Wallbacteria bacterium]